MLTQNAYGDSRLSLWLRVREYAVPPSMIEAATARRRAGDWAGACAAAGFDVDLDLRALARTHGGLLAARVRADLRHLAPDLLRWHMPRIAPDGLLRPGLTIPLARYQDGERSLHLVVRTPPAWADAGQRISLALWEAGQAAAGAHPHPRPHRRFRLDLHRHLWDARRADELRIRSGADRPPAGDRSPDPRCAVGRWPAEAELVLRAEGRRSGAVLVRPGARDPLLVDLTATGDGSGPPTVRISSLRAEDRASRLPVLPDAATWVLPDLELLRAGAVTADRLHPLVAAALVPGHVPPDSRRAPGTAGDPRLVECRGARHRIGQVDGILVPLDHGPDEIRREELLAALTGTPLPCLQAIDEVHRRPDCLPGVRERLDHGDTAGALAVVEGLLGPEAVLRDGPLRDELQAAAERRIVHGLFRAGLAEPRSRRVPDRGGSRDRRSRPRSATFR
ncbi:MULTISPECIES: hypothetical protein [unclassified Streptomyces]|uniref:hypothetical protein n=1 Tax=unclassified Streptomyces TaxID=2593676 RepID=UPI00381B4553